MRPKHRWSDPKKQRSFYSGKRKRHTLKSEVLIRRHTGRIVVTANAPGRCRDLTLRREAGSRLPEDVHVLADLGYQGLQHQHRLTVLPFKATKKRPPAPVERALNRAQAQLRVRVEQVIRRLKVFWILARPYRNRRRRFGLGLNLIVAIYNFELAHG
jgi:hypothetical protein